jgi:hypothetical protein
MPMFHQSVQKANAVSVVELRRLLVELAEKRPGICIRYRLMGELWARDFLEIAAITDKGVLLRDESGTKLTVISNLSDLIQFELDEPYQTYRPYNHYDVRVE